MDNPLVFNARTGKRYSADSIPPKLHRALKLRDAALKFIASNTSGGAGSRRREMRSAQHGNIYLELWTPRPESERPMWLKEKNCLTRLTITVSGHRVLRFKWADNGAYMLKFSRRKEWEEAILNLPSTDEQIN